MGSEAATVAEEEDGGGGWLCLAGWSWRRVLSREDLKQSMDGWSWPGVGMMDWEMDGKLIEVTEGDVIRRQP